MFIILGLVILVAAVVVGVAGVLTNHGSSHLLTHRFTVLGYHVNGSTGRLFLYGIVVGAVAVFGLSLLLSAARRTSRRGSVARQGLQQSRDETAAVTEDRDDLIDQRNALIKQRETARAKTASGSRNGSRNGNVDQDTDRRSLLHPLGRHAAPPQVTTAAPVTTGAPVTTAAPADS
jgi:gas vesicle protein